MQEFVIGGAGLSAAVGAISAAALDTAQEPGLVRMVGEGRTIRMYGRSAAASIVFPVGGDFEAPFECCVEYRQLAAMAAAMRDGPVQFRVKDGWAFVRAGATRFRVPAPASADFPPFEASSSIRKIAVAAAPLARAIRTCLIAVAKEDFGNYGLRNVHLAYRNGESTVSLEACDGKEAARATAPCTPAATSMDAMLPQRSAPAIIRLCQLDMTGDAMVGVDGSYVQFEVGDVALRAVTQAGQFPDTSRLIPETREHEVPVDRGAMIEVLSRAEMFTEKKIVRTRWGPSSVSAMSSRPGVGVFNESLGLRGGPGEPVDFLVSTQQVLGCLRQLRGDEVVFGFNSELSQVTIKSEPDDEGLVVDYVTMPFHPATADIEDLDSVWTEEARP